MADTFTTELRLVLQETGGNNNVWGGINNLSAIQLIETAISGRTAIDVTAADVVLTTSNGAADQARGAIMAVIGNPGVPRIITVPSTSKMYVVSNETSPAFSVTVKTAAGVGVIVTAGQKVLLYVDSLNDEVILVGSVLPALEGQAGIAELATQAEVDAASNDTKIVTPFKLANATSLLQATEVQRGALEIATQVETDAGADDARAITPLKLATRAASEVLTGVIELATQAEVDAGTDAVRAVTPATLRTGVVFPNRNGAKAFGSANQTISNSTLTAVAFNSESYDTDTIHDNVTNNSRLTVPAGITQIRLTGYTKWAANGSAFRFLSIRKDGGGASIDDDMASYAPSIYASAANASVPLLGVYIDSGIITVAATDFFELMCQQDSGGNLDLIAGDYWFQMEIIS